MSETVPPSSLGAPDSRLAVSLLVNSFRFSRGVQPTQKVILQYAAHKHRDKIDLADFGEVMDSAHKATLAYYENPHLHPQLPYLDPEDPVHQDIIRQNAHTETQKFGEYFYGQLNGRRPSGNALRLHGALLNSDEKWVPGVRESRFGEDYEFSHRATKNYSSNLISHGFLARLCGVPGYEGMFVLAAQTLLDSVEQKRSLSLIQYLRRDQLVVITDQLLQSNPSDREDLEKIYDVEKVRAGNEKWIANRGIWLGRLAATTKLI